MAIPKVGQVWERDGEHRTVAEVEPNANCSFTVRYSRPGTWPEYICSLWRWNAWAAMATLVSQKPPIVARRLALADYGKTLAEEKHHG